MVVDEVGAPWPAFDGLDVDVVVTTRNGGVSQGRYESLNLGLHVGDSDKDVLENALHKMVCNGDISLRDAQKAIAVDWIASYKRYVHQ